MITFLIGDNSFEIARYLEQLMTEFAGETEKFDGETMELRQLPDVFMGATLFAPKRLVIIKNLSENKAVWDTLPEWLERLSNDVHMVLVEVKPDRRSRAYKLLQKLADVHEFPAWSDRDSTKAVQWVTNEAKIHKIALDKKSVQALVARAGNNQWKLYHALQKLAVLPDVTPSVIEEVIEPTPAENVFNLLDAALQGDKVRVQKMLTVLETTEDPYRLFGLLSTQVFQLAVLGVASKSAGEVAKDIGAHPFALQKLAPHAKKLGRGGVRRAVTIMAEADTGLKTSAAEPWLLIERALLKIASA